MIRRTAPQNVPFQLSLELDRRDSSGFRISALITESEVGKASERAELKVTEVELNTIQAIAVSEKISSNEWVFLEEFGVRIFDAMMPGPVGITYHSAHQAAASKGQGLRIRIRLSSELAIIPWEFAYDRHHRCFICRSAKTALSRDIETPGADALPVNLPLQVLFVSAAPRDVATLNLGLEQKQIEARLKDLKTQNQVHCSFLQHATLESLREQLLRRNYHIVHFMCHGGMESESGQGYLLLEDGNAQSAVVNANQIQHLLRDIDTLRLVVLNACITSDLARSLSEAAVPAIVGMQFPVMDDSALVFAERLYALLADAWPVDCAIAEARNEIGINFPKRADWGTPLLYMRSDTGALFSIQTQPSAPQSNGVTARRSVQFAYRPHSVRVNSAIKAFDLIYQRSKQLAVDLSKALRSPAPFALSFKHQEAFGRALFDTIFSPDEFARFAKQYEDLESNQGMRLLVALGDDERVAEVPWELLHGGSALGFLATSAPRILFSRVVSTGLRRRMGGIDGPLRVLVILSEPPGVDVGCKQEEDVILEILRPLEEAGVVRVDVQWNPSPYDFQQWIVSSIYHMVWFSGIDSKMQGLGEGIVLVENGEQRFVEVKELCALFQGQNSVRLVVLNTCFTAQVISPALVKAGVTSVVGMQSAFDAEAGVLFPKYFLRSLFAGFPEFAVDMAVAQARTGFYLDEQRFGKNRTDWFTPVLTSSVTDGNFLIV